MRCCSRNCCTNIPASATPDDVLVATPLAADIISGAAGSGTPPAAVSWCGCGDSCMLGEKPGWPGAAGVAPLIGNVPAVDGDCDGVDTLCTGAGAVMRLETFVRVAEAATSGEPDGMFSANKQVRNRIGVVHQQKLKHKTEFAICHSLAYLFLAQGLRGGGGKGEEYLPIPLSFRGREQERLRRE